MSTCNQCESRASHAEQRQQRHQTNNKDCSKEEGPIVNGDLHEKEDYNSRGRKPEGLPERWSVCSKGERPMRLYHMNFGMLAHSLSSIYPSEVSFTCLYARGEHLLEYLTSMRTYSTGS